MTVYLKEANEGDCELLFQWANEELVRKNSFNSSQIEFKAHVRWFKNRLVSTDCYLYIFYINDIAIGQVRLDIENRIGLISYSLDKKYRGKGLALYMINLLEDKISQYNINIQSLVGYVKSNNLASQKIFERLNYNKLIDNENFKYYKFV